MLARREPGYEPCYPDGRIRVLVPQSMSQSALNSVSPDTGRETIDRRVAAGPRTETAEGPWLVWGRTSFAVAVVVALLALGIANVTMYSRWHEVEDGVLWGARAEGVTAIEIARGSAAAAAGVERG